MHAIVVNRLLELITEKRKELFSVKKTFLEKPLFTPVERVGYEIFQNTTRVIIIYDRCYKSRRR